MKIVIHPKHQTSGAFIAQIPELFDTHGDIIYQGRNTVKRFTNDNAAWIIKRYKRPNFFQRIAYTFFKKSKAERAYLFSHKLLEREINTPEGIAYIEEKKGGLIRDGYFISTLCIDPAVYPALVWPENYNRQLAASLAAFFVELHSKGILHGDPNLNNILFRKDNERSFLFSVIDTNRSIFKPSLTKQQCLNNLKRITHRRDLLQYIIEQYAIQRRWDTQECVDKVMHALDSFEKQRRIRHLILKRRK